jgi:PKD repeat protein
VNRLQKFALGALLAVAIAVPLSAATAPPSGYWVEPAATPNTDLVCSTCPCVSPSYCSNGMKVVGYPATLGKYVGRFLDSQNTEDYQQTFRTLRAKYVYPSPSNHRLYFIIGSAAFAYDMDSFFSRVTNHEALLLGSTWGSKAGWLPTNTWEKFLKQDQYFYAERSVWDTSSGADGQERLYWLDADDRNYLYLSTFYYGWGIVKDSGLTDGSPLTSVYQYSEKMHVGDDVEASIAVVLKSATIPGVYYTLISDTTTTNVFDSTNPSAPTRLASVRKGIGPRWAKSADLTRFALTPNSGGNLEIYSSDAFVAGGRPLFVDTAPAGMVMKSVATDGTNFFATVEDPNGYGNMIIRTYAPDANGYHKVAEFQTTRGGTSTNMRYDGGFMIWSGYVGGTSDLRLFKGNVNSFSEIDLSIPGASSSTPYFASFYSRALTSGYTAPFKWDTFWDSAVVKRNGHTYLIATAYGLGDVYELAASDTITVRSAGSVGTPNPNRAAGSSAGPFYGDPIGFTATPSSGTPASVLFDFGNPEAVAAQPNTANTQTGTQITHRYSGITVLPATRTVKATNVADANVNGATSVTLAMPTISAAIKNYKALPLQSNASSTMPIVLGDSFVDTSDGSVESHFTTWTLDGAATNALPSEAVSVGTCTASRTLSMAAHYGPYTGVSPNEVSQSDLAIGVTGMKYSVRPYVASVDVTSSGPNVVFNSSSRFSADPTLAASLATLTYKWELLSSTNTVLQTGPTGTGTSIASFSVPKSTFSSRGIRAHLVLTSPAALAGSCAGMETSESFTLPLNGPEPQINGGCTNNAPPCTFTAASLNAAVDPVADGWTYAWTIDGNPIAAATQTINPVFSGPGQHSVGLTVSNAIGTTAASAVSVTLNKTSTCQTIVPNSTFFIYYHGNTTSCGPGSPCGTGENVSFAANMTLGYNIGCSTHTFSWDFGDGATATGQNASHTYATTGTYNVTLTVTNDAGSVPMTTSLDVSANVQPQPTPPVPTPPVPTPPVPTPPVPTPPVPNPPVGGCPTLDFTSFYVYFVNQAQTCSIYTGNACGKNDTISFDAAPSFGYSVSCGTHSYSWNFGDGATSAGKSPTHAYTATGDYTVTVQVSNPRGSQSYTTTVHVGTGTTPPPVTPPVTPPGGNCPTINAGQNVWISYQGTTSNCTAGLPGNCQPSEQIAFTATSLSYDFSCGTHSFTWDFNDGTDPLTGRTVTHAFAGPGTYNVKCNITVNGTTTPLTQSIVVGSGDNGGTTPPDPNTPFPYDFKVDPIQVNGTLIPHNYLFTAFATGTSSSSPTYHWDFGDGTTGTGQIVAHTYSDGEDRTITLTVTGVSGNVKHSLSPPKRRASGGH